MSKMSDLIKALSETMIMQSMSITEQTFRMNRNYEWENWIEYFYMSENECNIGNNENIQQDATRWM